ncbi:hypothetical protein [Paenibacillus sp. KN14-4R]|uniref:hypothetical protein n=1 Tax=Paenibacillus sp. KN14-4R TaxID=3445773 RepID=UPI003FA03ABF
MSDSRRIWNRIHMVVELCILIGFIISIIPFGYAWSSSWVIPFVIISAVFSFVLSNGTFFTTLINIGMALLGLVPLLGYIPRIVGIIISFINMMIISNRSSSRS